MALVVGEIVVAVVVAAADNMAPLCLPAESDRFLIGAELGNTKGEHHNVLSCYLYELMSKKNPLPCSSHALRASSHGCQLQAPSMNTIKPQLASACIHQPYALRQSRLLRAPEAPSPPAAEIIVPLPSCNKVCPSYWSQPKSLFLLATWHAPIFPLQPSGPSRDVVLPSTKAKAMTWSLIC